MPKGRYPNQYFESPVIQKPCDEYFAEIDDFTYEIFEEEESWFGGVEFFVILPPLHYDGRFLKGIYYSHGVDAIVKTYPQVQDYFHGISDTMWCSYPASLHADGYFTHYQNPERDRAFRERNPERVDKALIPMDNADFVNDNIFKPRPGLDRDIDLFAVAKLEKAKNLPLLAKALKVYRKKYPKKRLTLTLVTGHPWDLNQRFLNDWEKTVMREVESVLVHTRDYIHLVKGYLNYENQLSEYFARSRVFVSATLLGWKNQRMHEAMCSNTPVVCMKEFNQHLRGEEPVIPEGAGLTSEYDPEALADTLHEALEHAGDFSPRNAYLKQSGRQRFLNRCVDAFPYYQEALPDFRAGCHYDNVWLDSAMRENYGRSLHEFCYLQDLWTFPFRTQGIEQIGPLLEHYASLMRNG